MFSEATPDASVVSATVAAFRAVSDVYLTPFTVTEISVTPVEAGRRSVAVVVATTLPTTATAGAATGVVAVSRALTEATNEPFRRTTPAVLAAPVVAAVAIASLPTTRLAVTDETVRAVAAAFATTPRAVAA